MSNIRYLMNDFSYKSNKQVIMIHIDNLLNTFDYIDFKDIIIMRHLDNLYLTYNPSTVKFILKENYVKKLKNYKQAI